MGDEYIFRKEKTTTVTEDGKENTRSVTIFSMTPEHIKFREDEEMKEIELDSIKKMYIGRNPNPKKLHVVMEDHWEGNLPKWVLDEFEDVPEKIAYHGGLTETRGPEVEETWFDKIRDYVDVSFKVFFIAVMCFMIFGVFLMFLISPCCFAPLSAVGVLGMIWLGFNIFSEEEVDERVWERRACLDPMSKESKKKAI